MQVTTKRRVGVALGIVGAGVLWYLLVPTWWSVGLALFAAVAFGVMRWRGGVRDFVEGFLPESYGAYRALFIFVFLLGALVVYNEAARYQKTTSPPLYLNGPTVQFGAPHEIPVIGRTKPTTYRYTITVDPHNCTNPASVQVQLYVQPASVPVEKQVNDLPIGRVFLSVADAHGSGDKSTVSDVTIPTNHSDGQEAGLRVHYSQAEFRDRGEFAHTIPAGTIISVDVGTWPMSATNPVTINFKADWVSPRSVGTCYVVLPTGGKNDGDPGKWAQPTASTTRIVVGKGEPRGTVLVSSSSAPPNDALIPQWTCLLNVPAQHPDCTGYVAYAKQGDADQSTDGVLRFAAMLGVCLAIVIELIIQPFCERRPDGA